MLLTELLSFLESLWFHLLGIARLWEQVLLFWQVCLGFRFCGVIAYLCVFFIYICYLYFRFLCYKHYPLVPATLHTPRSAFSL